MKISIPKITGREQLRAVHTVGCVDWPAEFPYAPEVRFGIGHTGSEIVLRFEVAEQAAMGRVTEDNGAVWEDSCVEFFINFDQTGYYNFEFNCIGTKLLGWRKEREKFIHAPQGIMRAIETFPSLGRRPVALRQGDIRWTLEAVIPVTAFFHHRIADLSGLTARANFYKCGDALPTPHFLSWAPIENPTPDFHLERFFGDVRFE